MRGRPIGEQETVLGPEPDVAFRCLNESRCIALYGVATCVGPAGFNYSWEVFNYSVCVELVAATNSSMGGRLALSNGTSCDVLLAGLDEIDDSTAATNASEMPPPSHLPRFQLCKEALQEAHVARVADVVRRSEGYTSHVVLALSPRIGPVAGGVSIGVCGLGFSQANEAVSHLACRFTDDRHAVDVPAVYVDPYQLRCVVPDFSAYAVGLPHIVSVEVTTNRGASWTQNRIPFAYYSTRPSIDAFGRPMWGYDSTFTKAAWQVEYAENEFGADVRPSYPTLGHPLNEGRPSPWDAPRDPFHATGVSAYAHPVELDTGTRFEPAEDLVARTEQTAAHGREGSWGDRMSFLRAHNLVPDVYRQDVVAARATFREVERKRNNGVI